MINNKEYQLTKYACYITSASMAIAANLSPLLFVTFRRMYGISYTLLGLLVVMNFSTQLLIDLIFTFFEKHFNIHKTVRLMPLITFFGLLIYAVLPRVFSESAYLWIGIGTLIFSVSSGLNEVLTSPVIAAIPSENPESEMSKLHSMYAWGVVFVVIFSTLFITFFGAENWSYLALLWSIVPLAAFFMFKYAKLPQMDNPEQKTSQKGAMSIGILLCTGCIFLGGAAECTMSQWVSSFIENAMSIPKLIGDILGAAMFAAFLGVGRTLYSRCGKNVLSVMLWGMAGAAVCYLAAGLSLNPAVGLAACAVTGICVSMLWPGTIIYVGEKFPGAGVWVYALMAAGGDMGASIAPQLVGILSDKVSLTNYAAKLSEVLHISTEQIGMRVGLLTSAAFPLAGVILVLLIKKYFSSKEQRNGA